MLSTTDTLVLAINWSGFPKNNPVYFHYYRVFDNWYICYAHYTHPNTFDCRNRSASSVARQWGKPKRTYKSTALYNIIATPLNIIFDLEEGFEEGSKRVLNS